MSGPLDRFERIARSVAAEQQPRQTARVDSIYGPVEVTAELIDPRELAEPDELLEPEALHPFETRNIHPDLPKKVRSLFDDGYTEEAVFQAFKFIEVEVKRISKIRRKVGFALMMDAFNEADPKIRLNDLLTDTDEDEQRGYRSIFAGATAGIRNPRGHEVEVGDTPDEALDYLALASLLLRRLDAAGVR